VNIPTLTDVLEPFQFVCHANALATDYRRLFITNNRIKGRSARASIDAMYSLGIDEPFSIDFGLLYPLVKSLNAGGNTEIEFKYEGDVLSWKSGAGHGRLAVAGTKDVEMLPRMSSNQGLVVSKELVKTLELGSIACSNSALESIGLHGMIMLEDNEKAFCISSDNVSIACASMPVEEGQLHSGTITVKPDDAQLLSLLASREGGRMVFNENAIYYSDPAIRAVVSPVSPLQHNLYDICSRNFDADKVARLPKDRIAAFVKRAAALTENREHCSVIVRAADNQITLEFTENRASSEEMYLLEDVSVPTPTEVMVDAIKLGKALQNCDYMLLDHMHRSMLVFRSADLSFHYLLAGRS
jgi:hypothetical protein